MVRAHYRSRTAGAPQNGATMYRAGGRVPASPAPVLVPVEGDLVECPVCHGGVRTVGAPFTDTEVGIVAGVTRVLGSHRFGGEPGGRQDKCCGSHTKVQT